MKEPYGEGLASHTGSESCAHSRKAGGEALTGAHAGGVLSRDMLKNQSADVVHDGGRQHRWMREASIHWTLRGQRPPHVWKLHARDPGGSTNAQ